MATRLLIVNNGLKDQRGHYFETSVATAYAAVRAGLKPILIGHVTCSPELIPKWLDFLPLCRLDHWMVNPAPSEPNLHGLRCDIRASLRFDLQMVLKGTATLSEYLLARFEPLPEIPTPPPKRKLRTRLKSCAKSFTPPLLWECAKAVFRRRRWAYAVAKATLPPFLYSRLRTIVRRSLGKPDATPIATSDSLSPPLRELPTSPSVSLHDSTVRLHKALLARGFPQEYDHQQQYFRDLEILLSLIRVGGNDHLFFPTAHARELLAIRRLVELLPPEVCPTFHLEFRHALDLNENDLVGLNGYTELHILAFDHYRSMGHHPRIRLYTDTEELTEVYSDLSGLPFETLPIPFRADLIIKRDYRTDFPITLTVLGDARDEKGFHLLPDLVEALSEQIAAGRVRFSLQASLIEPQYNPLCVPALERLKKLAGPNVILHGLDGPLNPDEYFSLLSQTDLMLCPYDRSSYKRRSSGILTEAVAAGVPTVVTAGTWLERQQPKGTGESFSDIPGFIAAVGKVIAEYPKYLRAARAVRSQWLAYHTPDNLVQALISSPKDVRLTLQCGVGDGREWSHREGAL